MFTLFLRGVLLYVILIVIMRVLGKRQMGELQPYEFTLTLLLAEIIADPVNRLIHFLIIAPDIPFFYRFEICK